MPTILTRKFCRQVSACNLFFALFVPFTMFVSLISCKTARHRSASNLLGDEKLSDQDYFNAQIERMREMSRRNSTLEYWKTLIQRIENDYKGIYVLGKPVDLRNADIKPEDILVVILTSGEFPGADQNMDLSGKGGFPTMVLENATIEKLSRNLKLIEQSPKPFKKFVFIVSAHGVTAVDPTLDKEKQLIPVEGGLLAKDHRYFIEIQRNVKTPFEKLLASLTENIKEPKKRIAILLDTCQSAGGHISVEKFRREMRSKGTPELGQLGVASSSIVHEYATGRKFSPFEKIVVDMLLNSYVYDRNHDGVIDAEEFVTSADSYVGRQTAGGLDQVVDANIFFKLPLIENGHSSALATHEWISAQPWYNELIRWTKKNKTCLVHTKSAK